VSRDWRLYWDDIIAACEKIQRYTAGMDFAAFQSDRKTYDAVLRNLEIIGEAAKNLPDDVRAKAPHVEWRKIAGLRAILAHGSFAVDDTILRDIVREKVPALLAALKAAEGRT